METIDVGIHIKAPIEQVWDAMAFDPPNYFEYRVRKSTLPMKHDLGRFKFKSTNSGTDVRWISRFELPFPVIGKMMEKSACRSMSKTFLSILEQAKADLEA